MRFSRLIPVVSALAMLAGPILFAASAGATFPGQNGRIAFISDRDDGLDIFTMNPDGSAVQQLTDLPPDIHALDPSWSPDSSHIVFARRNAATDSFAQIWVMGSDGSGQHRLIRDPWFRDSGPHYSPDGTKIVFTRCRPDFYACALAVSNADGTGVSALTPFGDETYDFFPVYSPDGSKIAFGSFNRGGVIAAIYVIHADGSGLRQVSPSRLAVQASEVSRADLRGAAITGAYGFESTSAGVHRLTPPALGASDPDWAPDGNRIAFFVHCCDPRNAQIWAIDLDGTDLTQLTHPGSRHDFSPAYAPAGDRIAFERDSPTFAHGGIWEMNPDGTGLVKVQGNDAFVPDWGPAA